MPDKRPTFDASQVHLRSDGTPKGSGYLGPIARPDGSISTELSMGTSDVDGQERDIPLMVPTLSEDEIRYLISAPADDWEHPTMQSITAKAIDFARGRQAKGQPFFAQSGEQDFSVAPSLRRAVPEGAELMTLPGQPLPPPSAFEDAVNKLMLRRRK
jgi:hypothetical protein